jgi:glycosyltransferase involved in cell wall biosynthesis
VNQKLSIVIPAYNEEKTIQTVLKAVASVELIGGFEKEIIVVNDCSKDGTESQIFTFKAQHPDVPVAYFKHEVNQGKGAALHTGIQQATGDYLVIQDADLEYDPKEYLKIITPILENKADAVYGSRFISGESRRVLYFWNRVANFILTTLSNIFTNLNFKGLTISDISIIVNS